MRHKVFWTYFASQSSFKKRMSLFGLGDFFGRTPKNSPPFCSTGPPSSDAPAPSSPAALPQGATGEGLGRGSGKAQLHLSPPNRPPSADFFWVDPKKVPLFSAQKSQKSRLRGGEISGPSPARSEGSVTRLFRAASYRAERRVPGSRQTASRPQASAFPTSSLPTCRVHESDQSLPVLRVRPDCRTN